jgi:hypothetical protein
VNDKGQNLENLGAESIGRSYRRPASRARVDCCNCTLVQYCSSIPAKALNNSRKNLKPTTCALSQLAATSHLHSCNSVQERNDGTMASTMRAAMNLQRSSMAANAIARRGLMTQSAAARVVRPAAGKILRSSILRQTARRGYASEPVTPTAGAPSATLSPAAPKKRRFRTLRWLWRATYLSVLAGTGYMAYTIFDLRHPDDQDEPDPSKQTLVILGMLNL